MLESLSIVTLNQSSSCRLPWGRYLYTRGEPLFYRVEVRCRGRKSDEAAEQPERVQVERHGAVAERLSRG